MPSSPSFDNPPLPQGRRLLPDSESESLGGFLPAGPIQAGLSSRSLCPRPEGRSFPKGTSKKARNQSMRSERFEVNDRNAGKICRTMRSASRRIRRYWRSGMFGLRKLLGLQRPVLCLFDWSLQVEKGIVGVYRRRDAISMDPSARNATADREQGLLAEQVSIWTGGGVDKLIRLQSAA